MATIDVTAARALTPGCEHVLHLNHAGASLLPQPVLDAVIDHLRLEGRIGGYEAADQAAPLLQRTYDALATLLGATPDQVALTDSATTAWNAAVQALPLGAGDRVLLGRAEYGGNAISLLRLRERTGCELVLVGDDRDGQIDVAALEAELQAGPTALVSLVHAPTGSGLVNPAEEVGRLCRAAGAPYLLDASQSVGQMPVDVEAIGCDLLVGNGRKFLRAPRGTGFLYVRPSMLPRLHPPTLDLRSGDWVAPERYEERPDARRFEQFECDMAGRIGLGVAVDHALGWGLEAIAERTAALAAGLRARLGEVPGVTVRDKGRRLSAITTFTVEGREPSQVVAALRAEGVNTSVTALSQAQHDLPHRGLGDVVRASVHYISTEDELDRAASAVRRLSPAATG
jgi:selenocysteine lyase/cysteine desulfurase